MRLSSNCLLIWFGGRLNKRTLSFWHSASECSGRGSSKSCFDIASAPDRRVIAVVARPVANQSLPHHCLPDRGLALIVATATQPQPGMLYRRFTGSFSLKWKGWLEVGSRDALVSHPDCSKRDCHIIMLKVTGALLWAHVFFQWCHCLLQYISLQSLFCLNVWFRCHKLLSLPLCSHEKCSQNCCHFSFSPTWNCF